MRLRPLSDDDRGLLREATLVNMNWVEPRFSLEDLDGRPDLAHYYTAFDAQRDFGFAAVDGDVVRALAWVVFLPADDPGYGFVDASTPELSITAFEGHRGRGVGAAVLGAVIDEGRRRRVPGISLSVEDGNRARHLYERAGFVVVGRNGNADTMLLELG
ncbi:N-acetyltransferase family protein [Agromyces bauzanensis]